MSQSNELKQLVGEEAVKYIKDGMKIGIGSGSTMYYAVKALGERVKQGLNVVGIPTSNTTAEWAKEFGVPLTDFTKVQELDLAIDGADEVDSNLQLIKGGGGALFREKVVADAAKKFLVIVDESKVVEHLGKFPLPVEVVPFGLEVTINKISKLGCEVVLRKTGDDVFITDNGNYILDCHFEQILEPKVLHNDLISLVGVVETGLFVDMTTKVLVGKTSGVEVIDKKF